MATVACNKDVVTAPVGNVVLSAVVEAGDTKTAVTGFSDVVWSQGDAIAVHNGTTFKTFTLASGAGTAAGTFSGNLAENETPVLAVYPDAAANSLENGVLTVTLPATYTYSEMGLNAPMVATVVENVLEFKHIGGAVKFDVANIPAEATSFVFTTNKAVTGDFQVTDGVVAAGNGPENNTVTITFDAGTVKNGTFIVPLPVGEYAGFTVALKAENGDVIEGTSKTSEKTLTVARKKLSAFPAYSAVATGTEVLWEGEKVCTNYDWFVLPVMPTFAEGDLLRVYYKDVQYSGDPSNPGYCLMMVKPDWSGNFLVNGAKYYPISREEPYFEINVTAELAAEFNGAGGAIVQGHNLTITKIEYVGTLTAETVLWTGNYNSGGFGWLPSTVNDGLQGVLPVTLKDGDVLCFYYVADATADYRVIQIKDDWGGDAHLITYPAADGTYSEIKLTQTDLDKYTGTMRLAFCNLTIQKISIK